MVILTAITILFLAGLIDHYEKKNLKRTYMVTSWEGSDIKQVTDLEGKVVRNFRFLPLVQDHSYQPLPLRHGALIDIWKDDDGPAHYVARYNPSWLLEHSIPTIEGDDLAQEIERICNQHEALTNINKNQPIVSFEICSNKEYLYHDGVPRTRTYER
jgi:hypothetical protein